MPAKRKDDILFLGSGKAALSGIARICTAITSNEAIIFDLPEGYYSVKIYLLSWDDGPGAYLGNREISSNALSDFVMILRSDADEKKTSRKKINTFSEDD